MRSILIWLDFIAHCALHGTGSFLQVAFGFLHCALCFQGWIIRGLTDCAFGFARDRKSVV